MKKEININYPARRNFYNCRSLKNTNGYLASLCLLMLLFLNFNSFAQQRSCGAVEYLEKQIQENPARGEQLNAIENHTRNFINGNIKRSGVDITIPVVVHVVWNTAAENISEAQILSQITVMNEDFRRLNANADDTWSQAADTEINFCLATIDPDGNPTTGITRTNTSVTEFTDDDAVKFDATDGHDAWPAADYLNLWVCDFDELGYAQFPGGPANTDGVVCDYEATGIGGTNVPPFHLGRTATHEVGHWLNLRHIWGDGPCSVDDMVGDTPVSDAPNYGCDTGHESCNTVDMVQNYMDYSDDDCMNLFTQQQSDRMNAMFATGGFRASLCNSIGCGISCELIVDCSNLEDRTFSCQGDIPAADESLVIIEESCGTVDITVVEQGTGTPGDPLVRRYLIVDEEGNTTECEQVFTVTGGLVVDCSNLEDQTFTCAEDIPAADENLVIIEESCGIVDISVVDEGTGTPGDPLVRSYLIEDEEGNTAECEQVFTVTGSEVTTANIWPRDCILHRFTIKGDFIACAPVTATSVDLKFYNNGNLILTVSTAASGPAGTWEYDSTLGTIVNLGLEFGTWYDVVPCLNLSDGTSIAGEEFEPGQNNDFYLADHSDPQVVVNTSATDATTSMAYICEGDPLYYHGVDPLSGNHFSAIRKKPKNSTGPFTNYQGEGWIGVSLDGYTGDLNAQYPGYFEVGYVYQLYIASFNGDPDVCIVWSPVTVEFEIVDCCMPNAYLDNVPDCIEIGKEFSITVVTDAPYSADDIDLIYSSSPSFTYVSHQMVNQGGQTIFTIWFEADYCSCEGEMLIADINIKGCSETIWVMTDKLPCCAEDCTITQVETWSFEDCIIVNGKPAREFCLEVSSTTEINDIMVGTNDITCQTDVLNMELQSTGPDTYSLCGLMVFDDPDCTGHALLTFKVDTKYGCCILEKAFSFPGGCQIPEPCLDLAPNIEAIFISDINVSLDLPMGTTVTVTDHITGNTSIETIGKVTCGPFGIDLNGTIVGGTSCAGIHLTAPSGLDCTDVEGERPNVPYHFEIRWGDCVWVLTGNYCDELIVLPHSPHYGGKKHPVDEEFLRVGSSGEPKVYPNPIRNTDVINFDMTELSQAVNNIRIIDMQGRLIESFIPDTEQQIFQHRLAAPLAQGVYLITLELADGSLNSTKLVSIE